MSTVWQSKKDQSRVDWGVHSARDKYPGDMAVIIGCLQRIADALEGIGEKLDPEWRKESKREQAKKDYDESVRQFERLLGDAVNAKCRPVEIRYRYSVERPILRHTKPSHIKNRWFRRDGARLTVDDYKQWTAAVEAMSLSDLPLPAPGELKWADAVRKALEKPQEGV